MSENIDSRSRSDSSEVAFRKIFIGGLSYSTDEEKLKKYFKSYGAVQDAVVMKDPVSKRSRGFGFITFYDVSSVDNALANEPHTIDSRKVEAKRAVPRSEIAKELSVPVSQKSSGSVSASPAVSVASSTTTSPQVSSYKSATASNSGYSTSGSTSSAQVALDSRHAVDPKINMEEYAYNKIFVGGLHYDTRDAEFRAYFEKYGKVISAEVMFNRETHKSRGFGFIVFELESGAVKVCAEKEHSIDGKVVEVKRAIPRSKISVTVPAVSPGTATHKSLSGSPPSATSASNTTSATSISTTAATPAAPVNIRADVRRAMSEETPSSAKVVTNLPPPLSSILSSANNSLSNAIRKPYNAAVTGSSPTAAGSAGSGAASAVRPGTTSYAAALKLGGGAGASSGNSVSGSSTATVAGSSVGGGHTDSDSGLTSIDVSRSSIHSGSTLTSASLSPTHGASSGLTGGIDLQSLLNNSHIPGLEQLNRPFRSYSEPIVKIEGSSSLNGEILTQFDLNSYSRLGPSAAIGRSNNSSRSSSILASQSMSETGNSRRQSFDLLGSHPQPSQHSSSVGLGQASNHTSSNSLANIPWLSSPPSLSLDAGDSHNNSGLLNTSGGSAHMPGPLSLLLPGPAATAGGAAALGGSAAGGSRAGASTGSVTPGATVENLFGLPNPATTTPTSFGGGFQGITSLQALAQHQQQQYMQLQAQQAQQQQQLQHQQQQQLQAAYQAYQQSPHQSFNPGFGGGGGGSLLDTSGLGMLPPAQHQVSGPSADVWSSMVMNHQQQQQQQHQMMQQFPPYYDPHMHSLQQQQQHQASVPQPQYVGAYFSPSGGSQPHPAHLQPQPSAFSNQQQAYPGSPYFAGGRNSGSMSLSPTSQSLQPQSLPPSAGLNSAFGRNELSEGDDLFKFNDLHLDSAEFDPKAPWLYASKH